MPKNGTRPEYTEKSHLRNEEVALCEIYFESESAYDCVAELGELGAVQFIDVSAIFSSSIRAQAMVVCLRGWEFEFIQ
jgi:hypothetical protein